MILCNFDEKIKASFRNFSKCFKLYGKQLKRIGLQIRKNAISVMMGRKFRKIPNLSRHLAWKRENKGSIGSLYSYKAPESFIDSFYWSKALFPKAENV